MDIREGRTWTLCLALFLSGCTSSAPPAGERLVADTLPDHRIWAGFLAWPSPDGKYLYTRDDSADVIRVSVDGSDVLPLTTERLGDRYGPGLKEGLAVSRSGDAIAIGWETWEDGGTFEIRLLRADGGGELRRCQDLSHRLGPLQWTRGGDAVITWYTVGADSAGVVELSAVDCSERVLAAWSISHGESLPNVWPGAQHLRVSPDGRFAVYAAGGNLWSVFLDEGEPTHLLTRFGSMAGPTWSPDGRYVLFTSDISGERDLYSLPVSEGHPTGGPRRIKQDVGWVTGQGFSDRGDYFYFHEDFKLSLYEVQIEPGSQQVVGAPRRVSRSDSWTATRGSWSPDGRYVVYVSEMADPWRHPRLIVRHYATGREEVLVVGDTIDAGFQPPLWSPDGSRVLIQGRGGRAYILGLTPGEVAEVTAACIPRGSTYSVLGWLSAEAVVVYHFTRQSGSLHSCNLSTGQDRELLVIPGVPRTPAREVSFSPTRSAVVVWRTTGEGFQQPVVYDLRSDDPLSSARHLQFFDEGLRDPEMYWMATSTWSDDGSELYVATWDMMKGGGHQRVGPGGYSSPSVSNLWAIRIDEGAVRELGEVVTESGMMGWGMQWLSLSPSSPVLLFTAGSKHNETGVIEGLMDVIGGP